MTAENLYLAIDLGTSCMKTALITTSGKVLGWVVTALQLIVTPDGGAEQDPQEWVASFIDCTRRLLPTTPARRKRCARCGVLLHTGRRHHPGRPAGQRPVQLHFVDGHARRSRTEKAVGRSPQTGRG